MRIIAFSAALLSAAVLSAQAKQNSPYSRFGLGDPINQFSALQAGIGGLTAAFHDPFHVNASNPASYAFLRATVMEVGLNAKKSYYKSGEDKLDAWSGNLAYLALGMTLRSPINELLDKNKSPWKFGLGFTLAPWTQVGYNVAEQDSLNGIGAVSDQLEGSGGSFRATWSGAARYKQTAFGVNLGWIFGKASYENTTEFENEPVLSFQDNFLDEIGLNGFSWRVGLQHDLVMKYAEKEKENPTKWVTFGIAAESAHKLNLRADQLRLRSRGKNLQGQYVDADTLLRVLDQKYDLTVPGGFNVGVHYVNSGKFSAGAQFGLENWSKYKNGARPETLRNTVSVSGGVEIIPDVLSYNRFAKRIRYRMGAYYRQDPRIISGKNLDDVGLSLGLGLPILLPRQQTSFINAALEIGKLGAQSPIEETYFRITLGFSLNDNTWFYKRRFE